MTVDELINKYNLPKELAGLKEVTDLVARYAGKPETTKHLAYYLVEKMTVGYPGDEKELVSKVANLAALYADKPESIIEFLAEEIRVAVKWDKESILKVVDCFSLNEVSALADSCAGKPKDVAESAFDLVGCATVYDRDIFLKAVGLAKLYASKQPRSITKVTDMFYIISVADDASDNQEKIFPRIIELAAKYVDKSEDDIAKMVDAIDNADWSNHKDLFKLIEDLAPLQ